MTGYDMAAAQLPNYETHLILIDVANEIFNTVCLPNVENLGDVFGRIVTFVWLISGETWQTGHLVRSGQFRVG